MHNKITKPVSAIQSLPFVPKARRKTAEFSPFPWQRQGQGPTHFSSQCHYHLSKTPRELKRRNQRKMPSKVTWESRISVTKGQIWGDKGKKNRFLSSLGSPPPPRRVSRRCEWLAVSVISLSFLSCSRIYVHSHLPRSFGGLSFLEGFVLGKFFKISI